MVFGRRGRNRSGSDGEDGSVQDGGDPGGVDDAPQEGPFDSSEVPAPPATGVDGVLDLGSVRVPLPVGGQIQVEMENDGAVRSVHLVTSAGRITVAAFAAPRSPGQWREVAAELAQGLRADRAEVTVEDGPWGREVVGVGSSGAMRFLGVDGPRWMVRCVAAGPPASAAELATTARQVLRGTVVVRGEEPLPVRTTLGITLPPALAQQLQAARAQAEQQARQAAQAPPVVEPPPAVQAPPADGPVPT